MLRRLVEVPIKKESQLLLAPLLEGKPVVFSIQDPKMRVKRRANTPILFITPVTVYGWDDDKRIMLSIPGYGSELIEPNKVKALHLYRIGLTMKTAKVLADALIELFK